MKIQFSVQGTVLRDYNWWESLAYNEDGSFSTYFYVGVICGGIIVILIIAAIIIGFCKGCGCRKDN